MNLRRLNEEGMRRMALFLDSFKGDNPQAYPEHLLEDEAYVMPVEPAVEMEKKPFPRRLELAEYLHDRLKEISQPDRDKGLWAWLSLYWFDQLCPVKSGKVKPGELAKWIPQLDQSRRYYRHLLLGPYLIYSLHADDPERAQVLLENSPEKPGEIVEQLASRPMLVTCRAVVKAATSLYMKSSGGFRSGASGKNAGSVRRLAEILMQFDLTFDLPTLESGQLLDMLPKEFDRYNPLRISKIEITT